MSTRTAELLMALIMGLASIALMVKSAELPIGWIPEEGPGGGAFPFWLSAIMLLCCIWTLINWWRRSTPQSRSDEPYFSGDALTQFLIGAGSLGVMIGLIHFIGVYGAIPFLLIFYMRFVGNHSWGLTLLLAIGIPIIVLLFFEKMLTITLPKGMTEQLFVDYVYDWMYTDWFSWLKSDD